MFGSRVDRVVEGDEATETNVKDVLRRRGLLFVATHGENVCDRPLTSYLVCHADDRHDGRLTAAEVFSSNVGADMVIMSACFSGLADRSPLPGDDLFGLQRAFLTSGARTVISGLWDIYDDTGPAIMLRTFRHLANGKPSAKALTSAQREFLDEQRKLGTHNPWCHPLFLVDLYGMRGGCGSHAMKWGL